MTGGYSLIDCFDVNITSESVKIEGIFKKYQMSKRKAFLLSNVTINNTQLNDVFSTPYFEDGKVCFPAYDGVIKISDTDYVTFESIADVIADKYLSKEDFLTIESDNTPYVSRSARDGLAKMELVGGTVAWNQIFPVDAEGATKSGVIYTNNGDGSWTLTGEPLLSSVFYNIDTEVGTLKYFYNHVYLINAKANKSGIGVCIVEAATGGSTIYRRIINDMGMVKLSLQNATTSYVRLEVRDYEHVDIGTVTIKPQIFDLTQMFGTAIADYVYSLEQSEAGSGIAWLQSYGFFTKDYYAYDAGSLQSVCTSARKITSLDGTVRTYPIDNEELRGLFKLDANNKLYADGDIYPPSGSGTRKYGILDLGSINWTSGSADSSGLYRWNGSITLNSIRNADAICSRFLYNKTSVHVVGQEEILIHGNDIYPFVFTKQSYADAATFKTAMSGVYLVYEFAEPTTFSADPYINPQRSEGTEEFVDGLTRDVMIPVGNESTYYKDELFNIIGEYIDSCDDAVIAMIPEGE